MTLGRFTVFLSLYGIIIDAMPPGGSMECLVFDEKGVKGFT